MIDKYAEKICEYYFDGKVSKLLFNNLPKNKRMFEYVLKNHFDYITTLMPNLLLMI